MTEQEKNLGIEVIKQFERIVAWLLMMVVSLIVAVSIFRVCLTVGHALLIGKEDPLSYEFFQHTFGQIMTVLIAIEFNHTIMQIAQRIQNIFQIKIVLLIAMLALSRKFIILDLSTTTGEQMFGLGFIMLVLGIVYWIVSRTNGRY